MPNLVQATAGGMPKINRRSFLGKAAVAIPAMGMAAIVPAEAAPTASPVLLLIAEHQSALAASDVAWNALSDLQEQHPMPCPKVRVAWMLKGRNDDGTDIKDPIYKYDRDDIEKHCAVDWDHIRRWNEHRSAEVIAKLTKSYEERLARLTDDLERQEAEVERMETSVGITAARDAACHASEVVGLALQAIVDHPPTSVDEVREVAAYLLDCENRSIQGFWEDEPVAIKGFLASLAGKGGEA